MNLQPTTAWPENTPHPPQDCPLICHWSTIVEGAAPPLGFSIFLFKTVNLPVGATEHQICSCRIRRHQMT